MLEFALQGQSAVCRAVQRPCVGLYCPWRCSKRVIISVGCVQSANYKQPTRSPSTFTAVRKVSKGRSMSRSKPMASGEYLLSRLIACQPLSLMAFRCRPDSIHNETICPLVVRRQTYKREIPQRCPRIGGAVHVSGTRCRQMHCAFVVPAVCLRRWSSIMARSRRLKM